MLLREFRYFLSIVSYILWNLLYFKVKNSIDEIILKYKIDAVAFIPPTVARKTQLMDFLSKKIKLNIPILKLSKIKSLVPVQQKSLKKVEDRMINASKTIQIDFIKEKHQNILLIDDVTGSGSTLNQTAKKFLLQKMIFFRG